MDNYLFKIPRKLFESNFNRFKLKTSLTRSEEPKKKTGIKKSRWNQETSKSHRVLGINKRSNVFGRKTSRTDHKRAISQKTFRRTAKNTRPSTTSCNKTTQKYKNISKISNNLISAEKNFLATLDSFDIKSRTGKKKYSRNYLDISNMKKTPLPRSDSKYDLSELRKLRDNYGEKVQKDFQKIKNEIMKSFLKRKQFEKFPDQKPKRIFQIPASSYSKKLRKNIKTERGGKKVKKFNQSPISNRKNLRMKRRRQSKFFKKFTAVTRLMAKSEYSVSVADGEDKLITKKKYYFRTNYKGRSKIVKVSDKKITYKNKTFEKKDKKKNEKMNKTATNFFERKSRGGLKKKKNSSSFDKKTKLGKSLKFLEDQLDTCEKISKEIHNLYHIYDCQKIKTYMTLENILNIVTLDPKLIKFIIIPHEDFIDIISMKYLFNFIFLSKKQLDGVLPKDEIKLDFNLRSEKMDIINGRKAQAKIRQKKKKKKKFNTLNLDSEGSSERPNALNLIPEGFEEIVEKFEKEKFGQAQFFVSEKIRRLPTAGNFKNYSVNNFTNISKVQKRITLLPNTGQNYKRPSVFLKKSKSYYSNRKMPQERVKRKVRDVDIMFKNISKIKFINYRLVEEFRLFHKKISELVKVLNKKKAQDKNLMLKHKLNKIKRVKLNLDSNTVTNYQEYVFSKNLVEKNLNISHDAKMIRNKNNYFLEELVKRAGLRVEDMKYVNRHDFIINNMYKNMLNASSQEIVSIEKKEL